MHPTDENNEVHESDEGHDDTKNAVPVERSVEVADGVIPSDG